MASSRKAHQPIDMAEAVNVTHPSHSTIFSIETTRKRTRMAEDSLDRLSSSPTNTSSALLACSLFPSNKEGLLESEIASLKAEVEQLQSLRRLDAIKHQSTEQRLKRYIVSLEQDANDSRSFSDEIRTQYEKLVEESSRRKKEDGQRIYFAEQKIVDLERRIEKQMEKEQILVSFQKSHPVLLQNDYHRLVDSEELDSDEDNFENRNPLNISSQGHNSEQIQLLVRILDRKNSLLQKQIKDYSTEMESLRLQLRESEEKRIGAESKLASSSPIRSKDATEAAHSPLSTAPTELLSELNSTRVRLADAQRIIRQQTRTMEDLQNKAKQLTFAKDTARRLEARSVQLEAEVATLRNERDTFENVEKLWSDWVQCFAKKHNHWLSPYKAALTESTSDKDISTTSAAQASKQFTPPPEMAAIQNLILALEDKYKKLEGENSQMKNELQASHRRANSYEDTARQSISNMEQALSEKKQLDNKLLQVEKQLKLIQAQEIIWRKESDGLRDLLATYKLVEDQLLQRSKTGPKPPPSHESGDKVEENSTELGLQVSLEASRDQIKVLEMELLDLRRESDELTRNHKALQDEHDRVMTKFNLLKDALLREREKAEEAEMRAMKAESLAGQGSFNESQTRVVHLRSNPLLLALRDKYEQEIHALKSAFEESKEVNSHRDSSLPMGLDPQKYNQRLKDNFRKQIGIFRESVYLITGYKIDMLTDTTDRPRFKVRSMYSEREEDHLMFIWPVLDEGELPKSLDLLDSQMAQTLMKEPCFKAMTQFNSVPAFTAGLTLALFEKQTFISE